MNLNQNQDFVSSSISSSIVAKQIKKTFHNKNILDQLSFALNPSQVYCFYGPNGRGKSTLLKIIAGAERKFEGSLHILGQDAQLDPEKVNQLRSFLPDHPQFYSKATTWDLLSFVASVRKINFKNLLDQSLKRFGLEELLSKPLEQQSLGEKKRSFFAVVLLESIPIWILDEPNNGLDDDYQSIFVDCVRAHTMRGGTVVIATHDPEMAVKLEAQSLYLYSNSLVSMSRS